MVTTSLDRIHIVIYMQRMQELFWITELQSHIMDMYRFGDDRIPDVELTTISGSAPVSKCKNEIKLKVAVK